MAASSRIHHAIARAIAGALWRDMPDNGDLERSTMDEFVAADATAGDRVLGANNVGIGWLVIGGAALVAMFPLAGIGWLIARRDGEGVGVAIAMAVTFFCAAVSF